MIGADATRHDPLGVPPVRLQHRRIRRYGRVRLLLDGRGREHDRPDPAVHDGERLGHHQGLGHDRCRLEGHDYILCLDFEDDEVGGIPEGWTRNGEFVSVQDDFAHLGTKSLRTDAQLDWRRCIEHDASMVGPAHWGRVFYPVQQPIPDADLVHSTHVSFVGVGPNVGEAEYRYFDSIKASSTGTGIENRLQFIFNVQPQGPEFGRGTGWLERYYEDLWHCAEWHVDAADQSFAFYYDGEELFSFTDGPGNYADSEIPDSYSIVTLGWTNYQTAPPGFVAWFDDFAIDDERIGCD